MLKPIMGVTDEIQGMVDRETRAWDARDAEALVSVFHPDMVWPWPPDSHAHDPLTWILPMGRYDRSRWKAAWQEPFDTHTLVQTEEDYPPREPHRDVK